MGTRAWYSYRYAAHEQMKRTLRSSTMMQQMPLDAFFDEGQFAREMQ